MQRKKRSRGKARVARMGLALALGGMGLPVVVPDIGQASGAGSGEPAGVTASPLRLFQAELPTPEDIFQQQCVVCHGPGGRGDGPAAPALKPPPADLTDSERMSQLSDEDISAVISGGRGSMPAFSSILSASALDDLVGFIRELGESGAGRDDQTGRTP